MTKTANSLPTVVGVAGWPWVWASIASARWSMARIGERLDHLVELRQPHLAHRVADGQRVGEVVDVFARAGEVGELGDPVEPERGESRAHVVLDGLHVVAGGRLEFGEFVDVGLAEAGDERAQRRGLLGAEPGWSRTARGR